ncbi:transposase Tn3 family protein [Cupriavidus basilensis OR16]|uniref:Transposase Tn3 family protein n=1 Tax=Cupriavidus basilensis OR16 TaxID=1127483 RepID=H1RZY1_9BURK|nr:transposase Tn3 family protein [Cupriavidus basilensis OR16]
MRKLESLVRTRLQQYQLAHADTLEDLVSQFRDVPQDGKLTKRRGLRHALLGIHTRFRLEAAAASKRR